MPAELALVLVWVMVLVPGWVSELVLEQLEQREVRPEQPEVWLAVLLGVRLAVLLGVRLEAPPALVTLLLSARCCKVSQTSIPLR